MKQCYTARCKLLHVSLISQTKSGNTIVTWLHVVVWEIMCLSFVILVNRSFKSLYNYMLVLLL